MAEAADALVELVDEMAARLRELDDAAVAAKPSPLEWSVKEILGHLIDSASNNHQRFIRGQYGKPLVSPGYAQDFWVIVQGYADCPWPELVYFWRLFNRHLARVMRRVPENMLDTECHVGPDEPVPLGYLIEDYVAHLKHHLTQIDELVKQD